MYLHVAHRHSFETLREIAKDLFGLNVHSPEFVVFKNQFALTYRTSYDRLLEGGSSGKAAVCSPAAVFLKPRTRSDSAA